MTPVDPSAHSVNRFVIDDRIIRVEVTVASPRLAVLGGVLSVAECEALIAAAKDHMQRAKVVDEHNVGSVEDRSRTSTGMHFPIGESAVADAIQRRLMGIIGAPLDHGEPLQVLRYGPGEVYEPHHDYFDDRPGDDTSTLKLHGQRVATLICYLTNVEAGGSTNFPGVGIEVRPTQGGAVHFLNVDASGAVDPTTLHGGAPVRSGEKWIVTQWCRDRPYRAEPAQK